MRNYGGHYSEIDRDTILSCKIYLSTSMSHFLLCSSLSPLSLLLGHRFSVVLFLSQISALRNVAS